MANTTFPYFTAAPIEPAASNPYFQMLSSIGNVYADSAKLDTDQLWTSSARIINEHITRAWMSASQACTAALAQNAAAIQQQSLAHLGAANQKAFEIMTRAFTDTMMAGWKLAPQLKAG
jgi:hypothetical protein